MRTLAPMPSSLIDPATRALNVGSFRGGLPPVDLSPLGQGALFRLLHRKRWVYVGIASGDLFIGAAVVNLGYATNCFAYAYDRAIGGIAADVSSIGPPGSAKVSDHSREGLHASFRNPLGGARVAFSRPPGEASYRVEIAGTDLQVSAHLSTVRTPPALGAVALLGGSPAGLMNATEKGLLLSVTGEAVIRGKRCRLDGGLAGYDYTQGYLDRNTAWRWAFFLGHAKGGERVGLNLVQGFVGEPECAVWVDDEVYPLPEARFAFDQTNPMAPWRVTTEDGSVDLDFEPGGLHAEEKNLGLVASRFIQPVGSYSGTIRVPGREPLVLERVLGVAEDQVVKW